MYVSSSNKTNRLLRYRTLNSSDVEEIEIIGKKEEYNKKLNKEGKENNISNTVDNNIEKKKKGIIDSGNKVKRISKDSNSEQNELDIESIDKILDEDDNIILPVTWKIIDTFFLWIIILIKILIFITLLCISCNEKKENCLACSNCENEKYEVSSLPIAGSLFGKK